MKYSMFHKIISGTSGFRTTSGLSPVSRGTCQGSRNIEVPEGVRTLKLQKVSGTFKKVKDLSKCGMFHESLVRNIRFQL